MTQTADDTRARHLFQRKLVAESLQISQELVHGLQVVVVGQAEAGRPLRKVHDVLRANPFVYGGCPWEGLSKTPGNYKLS